MPIVTLSAITGKDIPGLIESLERQRKELEFILTSLDNDNVLELSGNLINQGVVQAKHVQIGSETVFLAGYDPRNAESIKSIPVTFEAPTLADDGKILTYDATNDQFILKIKEAGGGESLPFFIAYGDFGPGTFVVFNINPGFSVSTIT